jgi:hypothetical protein
VLATAQASSSRKRGSPRARCSQKREPACESRWGEIKNAALTGLFKFEGAFGGTTGFLFGIAPELGIQYGF